MIAVRWLQPRVIHVVWPEIVTDSDLTRLFRQHDALLAADDGAYVALHETDSVPRLNAKQRSMLGTWVGENVHENHRHCRGVAFVTSSPVVRGLITAVNWLHTRPYPSRTFAERHEAMPWLRELLGTNDGASPSSPP